MSRRKLRAQWGAPHRRRSGVELKKPFLRVRGTQFAEARQGVA